MPSLADLLSMGKRYVQDAMPGGSLNQEWTPENVRTAAEVASMTPTPIGDVASAGLTIADLMEGNYGGAALNGVGLLPFVPAMGGVLRNAPLQDAATKHFGRTFSPDETGFILDNGTRLDLSGRHYATGYQRVGNEFKPKPGQQDYLRGGRNVDHRELDELVPGSQWDGLSDFINQTGAVRYMPNTGISVVDTNMPNATQVQKAVEDFRRSRTPMNVDVDTFSGSSRASQEFERPTVDAVMDFIRKHMKPGADK